MKKPTIKPIKHYSTEPIKKAPNYAPYHKLNNVEYLSVRGDKSLLKHDTYVADKSKYIMTLADGYYQIFNCFPKMTANEDASDLIFIDKYYKDLVFEDEDWVKAFIEFYKLTGHNAIKNTATGTWQ